MAAPGESSSREFRLLEQKQRELNCLYRIAEIFSDPTLSESEVCRSVVFIIPQCFAEPAAVGVRITAGPDVYGSLELADSGWCEHVDLIVDHRIIGQISVSYPEERLTVPGARPWEIGTDFLAVLAGQLGSHIEYLRLLHRDREQDGPVVTEQNGHHLGWQRVLEAFGTIDPPFVRSMGRKMMYHLGVSGVEQARETQPPRRQTDPGHGRLIATKSTAEDAGTESGPGESADRAFSLAADHLSDETIETLMHKWARDRRFNNLRAMVESGESLTEVARAIRSSFELLSPDRSSELLASERALQVSLIRRVLSDQLGYVRVAKDFIGIREIYRLLERDICSVPDRGQIGGKAAGLYLANQILRRHNRERQNPVDFKSPRAWYIPSDALQVLIHLNEFDDVVEQKYKGLEQIRSEYPHLIETFKRAHFPLPLLTDLRSLLDATKDSPIVVRSSSLLEDRAGVKLSGKYRSFFLASQGGKEQRLSKLTGAVAEVYASVFSPEALECRQREGLQDFVEEMSILLQEAVGRRVGEYFLPAFSGTASGGGGEDIALKLTLGLGSGEGGYYTTLSSRSVDAEQAADGESAPTHIDVVNLERDRVERVLLDDLLHECGPELAEYLRIETAPASHQTGDASNVPGGSFDYHRAAARSLLGKTTVADQFRQGLEILAGALSAPVEIEFAIVGEEIHLLQCRPRGAGSPA